MISLSSFRPGPAAAPFLSRGGGVKDIPRPVRSSPEQVIQIHERTWPAVFTDQVGEDGGLLVHALQRRGRGFPQRDWPDVSASTVQ